MRQPSPQPDELSPPFRPWHIQSIRLDQPLPEIQAKPGTAGTYTILWYDQTPLGHLWLRAESMPVPPRRLAAWAAEAIAPAVADALFHGPFQSHPNLPRILPRPSPEPATLEDLIANEKPLDALAARLTPLGATTPTVSVIICTRDRPEDLATCLESIEQLDPKPDQVIVVDNAPETDTTRQLVDRHQGVTYVPEPRPGLSVARNTGLAHATSELIAYTDDDVQVHPRWIGALRNAFDAPEIGVVTGLILPAALDSPAQLMFEGCEGAAGRGYRRRAYDAGYFTRTRRLTVGVWEIGAGANMAFRRELIDEIGPFDERLGAGASGCSEDSEFWYRALAAGRTCLYDPRAVVYHHHRRDLAGLKKQMRHYIRGHMSALFVQFRNHGDVGNLIAAFIRLPSYFARCALDRLRYANDQPPMLRAQMAGYLQGLFEVRRLLRPAQSKNAQNITQSEHGNEPTP